MKVQCFSIMSHSFHWKVGRVSGLIMATLSRGGAEVGGAATMEAPTGKMLQYEFVEKAVVDLARALYR